MNAPFLIPLWILKGILLSFFMSVIYINVVVGGSHMDEHDGSLALESRMKKSRECAAIVCGFFEGSVLLRLVVAWEYAGADDIYKYFFINLLRRKK